MPTIICMHDKGLDFYELDLEKDEYQWVSALALLGYSSLEIRKRADEVFQDMIDRGKKIIVINQLID
jgi:hypothetical protein